MSEYLNKALPTKVTVTGVTQLRSRGGVLEKSWREFQL
jgi:hypothetical protein